MGGENIRTRDMSRSQQGMKIGNEIACSARHRDCGAPTQMIRVKKSSRAVIGANPREPGNLQKHSAHPRLRWGAPDFGIISVPGLENHRRAARSAALEVHLAPIADFDETDKIA